MIWILSLVLVVHAKTTNLCDNVVLTSGSIKLNANEKTMICGSSKNNEAWKEIPLPQAELHLRSVLQNLGYLKPNFERKDKTLYVEAGPRSEIKSLHVRGADGILKPEKKRKAVGEPITPQKLDEIEAWANSGVRTQGFACPQIKVEAHQWDQSVHVNTTLGSEKKFSSLNYGDLDGLSADILDRYQPFQIGDIYDVRKTQIMSARMLADGLFQSAYFMTECTGREAHLELKTSVGKPKIFRFGIGASTEEFPFADISFRNARLDNKASSYTIQLHGSPRLQRLTFGSELYFFPGWHRSFLGPRFLVDREAESSYQTQNARVGVDLGRNWDMWGLRFNSRWGPTYNNTRTIRGLGPENITYPTFDGALNVASHVYESSIADQYEGWTGSFYYRGQSKGVGSKVDVNRYDFNFKHLWNVQGFSPPLFILGTRVETVAVDAIEMSEADVETLVPIKDRIFLGGDDNLRGFPRKSINNRGLGYLTSVYIGFELRLIEELPFKIQPLLLWDAARLGNRRYTVDPPLFMSEGAGLRWASPFGALRLTAARGRIWNDNKDPEYPEQWVYFFSFGQEF